MSPTLNNPLVKIGVLGVGGAGCNAVNMMIEEREASSDGNEITYSIFNDVTIIAANTDSQDLDNSSAEGRIQLGANHTSGWGAGAKPDVGRQSAEESKVDIATALEGLDMLFITAGMGGGTGTGAAPVIAEIAKQSDILTIGIVTKPFSFEGRKKMRLAEEGIDNLRNVVDTLVVIPNEKLVEMAEPTDGAREMFQRSNIVLLDAVRNIAELISHKSYINVDFADVKTIMTDMGVAMIGFGTATGETAALNAVKEALNNPLLSDICIDGSTRVLLHFGGMNIPLKELNEASDYVSSRIHEDAQFIWGVSADDASDRVSVLIVAEAVKGKNNEKKAPRRIEITDQSNLFDLANENSQSNSKVKKIITSELKEEEITIDIKDTLAPAAQLENETKAQKSVESEEIVIQMPDNLDIDDDDISVPSIFRQQRKQMASKMQEINIVDDEGEEVLMETFFSRSKGNNSEN